MNALRFTAQRLLLAAITLLVSAVLVFVALRVIPGDVSDVILANAARGGSELEAQRELIRERTGLDKPPVEQFVMWIGGALRGDLGVSFITQKDVGEIISERVPWSLALALLVTLMSAVIIVPAGIMTALFYRTWVDDTIRILAVLALSAPNFLVGLGLIYVLSLYVGWSPRTPPAQFFNDTAGNIQVLLLPALVQTIGTAAPAIRLMRSQLLEVLHQDYIRTARGKGLGERTIALVHATPVASGPVLAYSGFYLARMVGGLVVIEQMFFVPGVGSKLLQSIVTRDYPVAQGILLVTVAFVIVINVAVDLAVLRLDPRTREA